jgi:putative endonuclease
MDDKLPCVYILASQRNGTLYVGVTSDIRGRVWQHLQDATGFTARYGVHRLVFYELHADMAHAIQREKRLKKWNRAWKLRLIEEGNPEWRDLWPNVAGEGALGPRLRGDDGITPASSTDPSPTSTHPHVSR